MEEKQENSKRHLGKFGEDKAAAYLEGLGYKILERNFIYGHTGEIDIIARKDDTYVFVEVKTRTDAQYVEPEDVIIKSKQKKIIKVAEAYIDIHNIENFYCRLDVITLVKAEHGYEIHHMQDAFTK
ncbi:MAG: YraN family protein [Ignavibacteriales bacterium]|nr:YraN family protein [Ignavibacteriales bacterium]